MQNICLKPESEKGERKGGRKRQAARNGKNETGKKKKSYCEEGGAPVMIVKMLAATLYYPFLFLSFSMFGTSFIMSPFAQQKVYSEKLRNVGHCLISGILSSLSELSFVVN